MTSNPTPPYNPTPCYNQFQVDITRINDQLATTDDFHRPLYYSNVVSIMEKYLYDLYIGEVTSCDNSFKEMCKLPKFAMQKYPLQEILYQDIKAKVINSVKNMVWHRLNDLDPIFKKTFNIKMNISQALKHALEERHHFVHRNGFDLEGKAVVLTNADVSNAILLVSNFIKDIDIKFHTYLYSK